MLLESYVGTDRADKDLLNDAFVNSGTAGYLFFPHRETAGWWVDRDGWPTIEWMTQNNKRLVVLSSVGGDQERFPRQWDHAVETSSAATASTTKNGATSATRAWSVTSPRGLDL